MTENLEPVFAEDRERPEEVILLIHGIRTFGNWQAMVKRVLEEIPNALVVPIKFGYFDAFRFWFPLLTRNGPIKQVRREIQNVQRVHPGVRISVIAHSFETYAITTILKDTPNLVLHRLVLCGSIVRQQFRWEEVGLQLNTSVVNECGTRDVWPVLAKCLSWGYGDTGRHSFGRAAVQDREHDYAHSDFFNEEFVRSYWKPWFEEDRWVPSRWAENAPRSPWWLSMLSILPLQWLLVVLISLGPLLLCYFMSGPSSYDLPMSQYLAARDAAGPTGTAGRTEFFRNYGHRKVKWEGYVVKQAENGYFISAQKSEESKALVLFKRGEFKPLIPKGGYISFEGIVEGDIASGKLSIEDGRRLREQAPPP